MAGSACKTGIHQGDASASCAVCRWHIIYHRYSLIYDISKGTTNRHCGFPAFLCADQRVIHVYLFHKATDDAIWTPCCPFRPPCRASAAITNLRCAMKLDSSMLMKKPKPTSRWACPLRDCGNFKRQCFLLGVYYAGKPMLGAL